ncbi:MarR family winged helix-turn-helix transcriptional regulator [Brevundimonas vesicularis]|uniref:MarR family winged helix-turn-helix transcriptional regulator n=1 Tax=Brevundimonas vesicularis TaxID=41276 RepID=UPI00391849FE
MRLAYTVVGLSRRWIARTDEVLLGSDLTGGEIAVLLLLKENTSGMTQKELSVALALSAAVLSKRTNILVNKGMVIRSDLIGDRRANLNRLTAVGEKALDDWGKCVARLRLRTIEGLSEAELFQALQTLARLDENLRSDVDAAEI